MIATPQLQTIVTSEAPRKRRRKTPVGGAASDCHRCKERNETCDRRRPYCFQCLEIGNECSGYTTQLTWGVGVASRGKLRGLSLPVEKSAPAIKDVKVERPFSKRSQSMATIPKTACHRQFKREDVQNARPIAAIRRSNSYTMHNHERNSSTTAIQIPDMKTDWTATNAENYLESDLGNASSISQIAAQHGPQDLNVLMSSSDSHVSPPVGSLDSLQDQSFVSSQRTSFSSHETHLPATMAMFSFPIQDSTIDRSYTSIYENYHPLSVPLSSEQSDMNSNMVGYRGAIFEDNDQSSATIHLNDSYRVVEAAYDDTVSAVSTTYETETYLSHSTHRGSVWSTHDNDYLGFSSRQRDSFSYPSLDFDYPALDLLEPVIEENEVSPRLRFYLNYYEKVICPATVAVDTSSNPYRQEILNLATDSEGLQHAICALAACNLRLKRKQAAAERIWSQQQRYGRQDPFNVCFHRPDDFEPRHDYMYGSPNDEIALHEEHHHRNMAVNLLNTALSSPASACHDSVLATLLVLCHYRMCESGVAQFRTQFAGAKKLMGMRNVGIETCKWGWMETAFTFFDVLTATVNEREAQLRGGYVEMLVNPQSPDQALENFAGVDGKLFKIIANLGRLNLLSQERIVLPMLTNCPRLPSPSTEAPRPRLNGSALADYYRKNPTNFDGNGFATALTGCVDYTSMTSTQIVPSGCQDPDLRSQFWYEWQSVRQALETWSFARHSLLRNLPLDSPRISEAEIRDFNLVSEAFRYAALLYTERLAYPDSPSDSHNLQQYVRQTLSFVSGLSDGSRMEKFMLWPLFVAGSEAVDDGDREVVREICKSIGARSGYANNSSALEVLESVWESFGSVDVIDGAKQPFRWTRHMNTADGEFILV